MSTVIASNDKRRQWSEQVLTKFTETKKEIEPDMWVFFWVALPFSQTWVQSESQDHRSAPQSQCRSRPISVFATRSNLLEDVYFSEKVDEIRRQKT